MQHQYPGFEPSDSSFWSSQRWQRHLCVKRRAFAKVWVWSSVHNANSREQFLAVCLYPDCQSIGQTFTSQEEIDHHIEQCHCGKKDQSYVCAHRDCYKWYAHRVSAHRHQTCEREGQIFRCGVPGCEHWSNRRDACKVHERNCRQRHLVRETRYFPYQTVSSSSGICL